MINPKYKTIALQLLFIVWSASLFTLGYVQGKDNVQQRWDSEKTIISLKMAELEGRNDELKRQHQIYEEQNELRLKLQNELHQKQLNDIERSYVERLRQSEDRTKIYQQRSQGSPIERHNLAEYTTRLDRQLEDGIRVVEILKNLVEKRDAELKVVGEQLKQDRKLLEQYGKN